MNDSIRLGRVAGVQVGLNWSLIAMVVLVAYELAENRFSFEAPGHSGGAYAVAGVVTAVGLLVGVLLHELGHAVLARRSGLAVDGITLSWMGGVTRIEGEAIRPRTEFVIAGIGPAVSAAFGGLLWLAHIGLKALGANELVLAAVAWLAAINVVLAVFNLLPAAPLDGGRILHALVWAVARDRWRATRVAAVTGIGLGIGIVMLGFYFTSRSGSLANGLFVGAVGWWIVISARSELGYGAVHKALDGVSIGEVMRPIGAAPAWITVRSFADGFAGPRPGWVWLLESWGGGYEGVLSGDSLSRVPFPQWDHVRPADIALPISSTTGAAPEENTLDVLTRTGGKDVIIVVKDGRSIGAVMPSDLEAMVRMASRGRPVAGTRPATQRTR
jgi:Zn-dependent protease